ncbi:MAG: hypothetical protein QW051_03400 [Candidatus Aenigmatarchaeota archaeon]
MLSQGLKIHCPSCGRDFRISRVEIDRGQVRCPNSSCGTIFNTKQIKDEMREMEKALRKYAKNFTIKIKI